VNTNSPGTPSESSATVNCGVAKQSTATTSEAVRQVIDFELSKDIPYEYTANAIFKYCNRRFAGKKNGTWPCSQLLGCGVSAQLW